MKEIHGYVFAANPPEPIDISTLDLHAETLPQAKALIQKICEQLHSEYYLITLV